MARVLPTSLMLLLISPPLIAADPPRTLVEAKKGQWVSFKFTTDLVDEHESGTIKQLVVARDDKSITLELSRPSVPNFEPHRDTIDLTQAFSPIRDFFGSGATEVKSTDEEKETITVGGKKYDCVRIRYKGTAEFFGNYEHTFWLSKDAPLTGLVKAEFKASGFHEVFEFEKAGKD